ncbi:hypothetical protein CROQUDRAFT_661726 [Cronartium quercuum f. sp. fusiforme G11]|uniref:Uncharacterized protein n=1 Tax=Cronartium quercuum f. sp. fusiforme G11 TaxID=708437 RepID=A0A9P6NBW2_9BASI|nr:hypothetical protein CROQUDRAFT_661726 [Cronartium quercuum f. sp. fusiforme G11]
MDPENAHIKPRSSRARMPVLLTECLAESVGTFLYVFPGEGATAALLIAGTSPANANLGSLLNVALSYSFGLMLAVLITAHISGAHLSPGVTITFTLLRGFPIRKVAPYLLAQFLGAIVATLCIYAIYGQQLHDIKLALEAAGKSQLVISATGPASVGGIFPGANQNLGRVFFGEWLLGCVLGLVIFGALDHRNPLMDPRQVPFLVGMAYLMAIIGFAPNTIVLNTARGLGGHIATSMLYGRGVFENRSYIALAALTNIPATLVGGLLYKLLHVQRAEETVTTVVHAKQDEETTATNS